MGAFDPTVLTVEGEGYEGYTPQLPFSPIITLSDIRVQSLSMYDFTIQIEYWEEGGEPISIGTFDYNGGATQVIDPDIEIDADPYTPHTYYFKAGFYRVGGGGETADDEATGSVEAYGTVGTTATILTPTRGECDVGEGGRVILTVCEDVSTEHPGTALKPNTSDRAFAWQVSPKGRDWMSVEQALDAGYFLNIEFTDDTVNNPNPGFEGKTVRRSTLEIQPSMAGQYEFRVFTEYALPTDDEPSPVTIMQAYSEVSTIIAGNVGSMYDVSGSSIQLALNMDALNLPTSSISQRLPMYLWIDATGKMTNLCDRERFMVLREGIEGFSGSTAEYLTDQTQNLMAETLRQTSVLKREFGFSVVIIGESHTDLEEKRKELLAAFSHRLGTGELVKTFDDGKSVRIKCNISPGYPNISDGLPMRYQARSQVVEIQFTAPDPYFYGTEQAAFGDADGNLTVYNEGDTATPCVVVIKSETCKNKTMNKSMKNRSGRSIVGLTVSTNDRRVTAVNAGGDNSLANFSHDSQFWMLECGENELEGVESVTFTPRWSGV